jgi:dATP pyrophosphohydrolase
MQVRYFVICYAVRATLDSHEFLQLKRVAGDYMGGTWQAVSGGIDSGETAWQAVMRELKEEAGLEPLELYRLPEVNTFYISEQDALCHGIPFCAIVPGDAAVILNEEHDSLRWVGRRNVNESFIWAADRNAIAELCRSILDGGGAKPYLRVPI